MRIAVLSTSSPSSRASWSGIPYFAAREIKRRFGDVAIIDTPLIDRLVIKAHKFGKSRVQLLREPLLVGAYAAFLKHRLQPVAPDIVVSIGAPQKIGGLLRDHRVIHVTDAMFDTIVDYYPRYANLHPRSRRLGHALQQRIVDEGAGLMVASQWAAQSAQQHYGCPADAITVAPMGANLETSPPAPALRSNESPLRLLFIGYEWDRKGGPLALDILAALRRHEPAAELHIVGCNPRAVAGVPGVRVHGPLSKAYAPHAALFERLLREASFFCMPSLQEAYGLVYCEACAYGLPPVARDTGGVGEIIRDGENGLLLPAAAEAPEYAAAIIAIWRDRQRYAAMQLAARQAYETRLNWQAWGAVLEQVIARALARPRPPA